MSIRATACGDRFIAVRALHAFLKSVNMVRTKEQESLSLDKPTIFSQMEVSVRTGSGRNAGLEFLQE
jgi:hypothetical protein